MNLSIRNMNHTVGERKETGIPLTTLEKLAAKLDVAQSLQKQTGWSEIVSKGWEMEGDVFVALVDFANSDPQHVMNTEREEDYGHRFTIAGGEVMELDAHLESQYELNTEEDMPF